MIYYTIKTFRFNLINQGAGGGGGGGPLPRGAWNWLRYLIVALSVPYT